jgi:hypothetical protein
LSKGGTAAPARQTQPDPAKLLTEDEHKDLKDAADDLGVGYRVEDGLSDGNPFSKGTGREQSVATIDPKTGEVVINAREFSKYRKLGGTALARKAVTRDVAFEEVAHLASDPSAMASMTSLIC